MIIKIKKFLWHFNESFLVACMCEEFIPCSESFAEFSLFSQSSLYSLRVLSILSHFHCGRYLLSLATNYEII